MVSPTNNRIKVVRLGFMKYGHADMETTKQFMADFGMHIEAEDDDTVYFGGTGIDPYVYAAQKTATPEFQGGVFIAASRDELEKAARVLPDAKGPFKLKGPGGGEMVSSIDPDGIPFHIAYGIKEREDVEPGLKRSANRPIVKTRKGEFLRFTDEPARAHKLGHFGLLVSDFHKTFDFYTKHLTIKPSDILITEDGKQVAGFCHFETDATHYVDHHAFFFSQNVKRIGVHHCSFEVQDMDTQMMGHRWLESKGYTSSWGVGRHILGSQLFDYWFQPEGKFMIEHYADGDVVNDSHVTGTLPASDEALAVWGPAVPEGFLDD
ncbi:MAG: hypothetical protein CYPHOPRED_002456 [Cyphobasidiales sp. Tagirdzhanova-0007]|nr:MAG: hypothetical protein CYPHOPRED_002456 [Cyphobasidiales sp. Tagirdzhanova-0007]